MRSMHLSAEAALPNKCIYSFMRGMFMRSRVDWATWLYCASPSTLRRRIPVRNMLVAVAARWAAGDSPDTQVPVLK